jgi:hypothetical protein
MLSQISFQAAQKKQEEAKHLVADAAALLETLCSTKPSLEATECVLRPVLRLLLWLIPEHIPMPVPTQAASQPESAALQQRAGSGRQDKSERAEAAWKEELEVAFVQDVATVS